MSDEQPDLMKVLSGIQKRLDHFETQLRFFADQFSSDKKIWEDSQEVADIGNLGGKEITEENGFKKKTTLIRACDCCGDILENQFVICTIDKRKVCTSCTVSLEGQKVCRDCMRLTRPLSKPSYKALYLISFQIDNDRKIHDIVKIPNSEIKDSKRFLFESGYIIRKGLTGFKITERGMNILTAYRQIYGNDEDVKSLESEMKKRFGI